MDTSVITYPLRAALAADTGGRRLHNIMIEVNLCYPKGTDSARRAITKAIAKITRKREVQAPTTSSYVYARLSTRAIQTLVREAGLSIHYIWPDFKVRAA